MGRQLNYYGRILSDFSSSEPNHQETRWLVPGHSSLGDVPAALILPESLLEMLNHRLHPRLPESESRFRKSPEDPCECYSLQSPILDCDCAVKRMPGWEGWISSCRLVRASDSEKAAFSQGRGEPYSSWPLSLIPLPPNPYPPPSYSSVPNPL